MKNVHPSTHPLIAHKLSLLRDVNTNPKLFRELICEISSLLTYEATQDSTLVDIEVQTPLSNAVAKQIKEKSGIVPILRAGLGMVDGILKFLPNAKVLHIGLYRDEKTLQPIEYYNKLTETCCVDRVFVIDPMLATGGSVTATIDILKKWGTKKITFIGIIAAPEGIAEVQKNHPDVQIYVAAIDERLTTKNDSFPPGYIFPGLGDAGDRQFGT
ncbi:uracil phosphoribosyltransferase [Candidatus Roizmanbacteria bacterium CG11_big_fil_rev_8_21_14_0_20_36_8]|uniref:Uracil phosphoribosyltransferase n=2 Tax=Candidatus Roizmaniibacteriota TaxID=1752723 RepID=A0A2M6IUM4_9BACT|nr:MAG: uracil phosphoribosyltransferase [Candidatus Roizmanbacteria bacterium CG11_big_fil_rev_8_21_14_0_20_36_8]PIZ62040.1 MAG: uracil phosphoribosyltransferase [Candidatus Roizmanbacteria bacterium CG_4_10_14_0_2_um_filter_39_13]